MTPPDDDSLSRALLIRLLREQQADRRRQRDFDMRGKQCPIQRPMRDRWR